MKFWKILNSLIEETLPEWRDKFLSYKDLKKQLKIIYPEESVVDRADSCGGVPSKRQRLGDGDGDDGKEREIDDGDSEVTKEVIDFVKLLEEEIDKFNSFFVDNEENYIIRLKVLQDRVGEARSLNGDLIKVGREIVDFHGEMVLLENYSALNYTGLVKILKKYEKRSGALIRMPFIQKVLQEPFFKIDVLNELVRECETMLNHLFSLNELSTQSEAPEGKESCKLQAVTKNTDTTREEPLKVPELEEIEFMENTYVKLATSALRVLKEIRGGSSTVDMFSLPPLGKNESEEFWMKTPIVEQAAK